MAEETRNYIEQTQARARDYFGGEALTPAEMAHEFAKRGIDERVDILDNLDRDVNGTGSLSVSEAAEMHQYVGALRRTHETLRKVGR